MNIKRHIVAAVTQREKLFQEILRPVFSLLYIKRRGRKIAPSNFHTF